MANAKIPTVSLLCRTLFPVIFISKTFFFYNIKNYIYILFIHTELYSKVDDNHGNFFLSDLRFCRHNCFHKILGHVVICETFNFSTI